VGCQQQLILCAARMFELLSLPTSLNVAVYGLALHFMQHLAESVKDKDYVLLFDEVLNKKAHQKQPDIHVHFGKVPRSLNVNIHPF